MEGEIDGERGIGVMDLLNCFLMSRGVINFGLYLTFTIEVHLVNVHMRLLWAAAGNPATRID